MPSGSLNENLTTFNFWNVPDQIVILVQKLWQQIFVELI